MGGSTTLGLAFVLLFFILVVAFMVRGRRESGWRLREIRAFQCTGRSIGLAVESGKRLHVSLGRGSVASSTSAPGLVGLSVLERIARATSMSDRPLIATSGDSGLAILSRDALKSAYREVGALDQYLATSGRLSGLTPFSYAAGALPVMYDEESSLNIFLGNFGAEAALMIDASERGGGITLAGSDSLPTQAVIYAAAHEPLIGEEMFAAGAYVQAGPAHLASLRAQDVLRWALVGGILAGAALKLLGVI
ncbi:MAG: hypothetical protein PHS96_14165 [Anaerolineales bacterium]|nr:hypothetical protein [Anaerolineales bacterium]